MAEKPVEETVEELIECCHESGHHFECQPVSITEFLKENANCRRFVRLFIFCTRCSQGRFQEDPDAPVIGE